MSTPSATKRTDPSESKDSPWVRRFVARTPWPLAAGLVVVLAMGWSAFLLVLHGDGHAPSGPLFLPVERGNYYRFEAWALPPWLALSWLLAATAAQGCAKKLGGAGLWADTAKSLAWAISLPMGLLWLLPDWLAYGRGGFSSLACAMRIYAPLASLGMLALFAGAVATVHKLNPKRALLAGGLGFVLHNLITAVLLR